MQIAFKRQRLIVETAIVEVTDDELRAADIDPDMVSDADIEDVADQLGLFDQAIYDETEGWEDVGDIEVEIRSY